MKKELETSFGTWVVKRKEKQCREIYGSERQKRTKHSGDTTSLSTVKTNKQTKNSLKSLDFATFTEERVMI